MNLYVLILCSLQIFITAEIVLNRFIDTGEYKRYGLDTKSSYRRITPTNIFQYSCSLMTKVLKSILESVELISEIFIQDIQYFDGDWSIDFWSLICPLSQILIQCINFLMYKFQEKESLSTPKRSPIIELISRILEMSYICIITIYKLCKIYIITLLSEDNTLPLISITSGLMYNSNITLEQVLDVLKNIIEYFNILESITKNIKKQILFDHKKHFLFPDVKYVPEKIKDMILEIIDFLLIMTNQEIEKTVMSLGEDNIVKKEQRKERLNLDQHLKNEIVLNLLTECCNYRIIYLNITVYDLIYLGDEENKQVIFKLLNFF